MATSPVRFNMSTNLTELPLLIHTLTTLSLQSVCAILPAFPNISVGEQWQWLEGLHSQSPRHSVLVGMPFDRAYTKVKMRLLL